MPDPQRSKDAKIRAPGEPQQEPRVPAKPRTAKEEQNARVAEGEAERAAGRERRGRDPESRSEEPAESR